ncbi:MAG: NADP-dependent oxidoreductase [Alphaproteobacteria bacterium]|nr:NADP-dependent oxidoreductase [Rhodospirillales bacterium]MCW9045624.1 NADP-dependent oxidoreductase [Alphaproteobacteria bacterium]
MKSREIQLKSRPDGQPTPDNFSLVEVDIPEIKDGELLIENSWMSVDPYMRGRMVDRKSYVPPFQIGEALSGGAIGEVIQSKNDTFKVGDQVLHMGGWREKFVSNGEMVNTITPNPLPIQTFLGTMGMPGMTAYAGLLRIGEPKEGDTVFVSAASGAVGSVVCQIAKAKGCRVVGSVGSDEKANWLLNEVGIDGVVNYKKTKNLQKEIAQHCPKGIDVYFENVGGAHFEAALNLLNPFGRVAMCGMIDRYNDTKPVPGPSNLVQIVGKSLKVQGFIVSNHYDMQPEFIADMSKWIGEGKIKWQETVYEGIEKAPNAFLALFSGENFGKMLVKIK